MKCQICEEREATHDSPIIGIGSWANMCQDCLKTVGSESLSSELNKPTNEGMKYDPAIEQEHADSLTESEMEELMFDSVIETADGCTVEPDGTCSHGYRSPLLVLGII